jgi:hypothetical protein
MQTFCSAREHPWTIEVTERMTAFGCAALSVIHGVCRLLWSMNARRVVVGREGRDWLDVVDESKSALTPVPRGKAVDPPSSFRLKNTN